MSILRLILSVGTIGLLGGLYAASQASYWQGADAAKNYAAWVDAPWMRVLSLGIFLAALGLGFWRQNDASETTN